MSKAAIGEIAVGAGLVALDLLAPGFGIVLSSTVQSLLVGAGSSLILGGIGTILSKPQTGLASATRNPIQPWNVIYGRTKIGGTTVYIEETGDSDKYLHMVLVLACHPCQSVDVLLFDDQRVRLDGNGNSYSPSQQQVNITSISRVNEVVTVTLAATLNVLDGDIVQIQNVSDHSFNGQYQITLISATSFSYICGGIQNSSSGGSVKTTYPDYKNTIHMETLLGNHTSTFPTLVAASNGLWTNQHLLLGRTAVYLQLHYDENVYANGLPTISFLAHGKNDILDPRTSTHGYTENAALCIADYLAQPVWGFKGNYGTEIPTAALIGAANTCDEAVPLAAGGSEPRYALNGTFSLSLKRGEVLQNMLTACGGRLTYSGGQFQIHPAAWSGVSLTIGDNVTAAPNAPMLMNNQGLVVNAYNNASGRGDYFDQAAGTSEGQALMIKGLLDAYTATSNPQALSLAQLALSSVLSVLYRGATIPAEGSTQPFAPHWLFGVKTPFRSALINYSHQFTFTNGIATIPDPPDGRLRYVFQVLSPGSTLLWNNPYSALTSGTSYPFTYSSTGSSTTVTLSGSGAGFNGPLQIIYSNQSTAAPMVQVGQAFEAWPDERPLAAGEIDAAMDTFNWFYRAYQTASGVIGGEWGAALTATAQQASTAMTVNDNRDWIKLTFTGDPFSEGSRFKYADAGRLPAPVFGCDTQANVFVSMKAGTGEVQYGNAGITDNYNAGDSTLITIGSTVSQSVTVFIDPTQTYVAANRYSATLTLSGSSLQTFTLTAANFTNPAGQAIPSGTSVYTVGISDTATAAHILTIGRVRQLPNRTVLYSPGVVPYTCNLLGTPEPQLVDWRGDAYIGYQQPWLWHQLGNETAVANTVQLLKDAQTAWSSQSGQTGGITGPFAPVFHLDRQDASSDGTVNTFSWTGDGDPHSSWGGYQYRPLAELAELVLDTTTITSTLFTAGYPGQTHTDAQSQTISSGFVARYILAQITELSAVSGSVTLSIQLPGQTQAQAYKMNLVTDHQISAQQSSGDLQIFQLPAPVIMTPNSQWTVWCDNASTYCDVDVYLSSSNAATAPAYYNTALAVADAFLSYLSGQWSVINNGPPTEFPAAGPSQVTYPEPHFAALIIRAVLLMDQAKRPIGNLSGTMDPFNQDLLTKALSFWNYWYQSSGPMAGTFCTDVPNKTWFGFWHGELLRTFSLLLTWASDPNINQPATAADASNLDRRPGRLCRRERGLGTKFLIRANSRQRLGSVSVEAQSFYARSLQRGEGEVRLPGQ